MQSERYKIGLEKLKEIDGEAGEQVIHSLQEISPELGIFIVEYCFGDIYNLNELDLKSKELAVVAALTAMGNARPQLKVHLNGALNTGSTISEIKEVILQMSVYSGFPRAINGMTALQETLEERKQHGITDQLGDEPADCSKGQRFDIGAQELAKLDNDQMDKLQTAFGGFSPELIRFTVEFGYADIFSRNNLIPKYRQLATIAALTALGTSYTQLKFHIKGGLNVGLTAAQIKEVMLLMSVFSGFPSAINGTNALKEILSEEAVS